MLPGIALALVTSLSWAVANVTVARSGRAIGEVRSLAWALLLGTLPALGLGLLLDPPLRADWPAALPTLAVASVFGLLGYVGMFYAFAKAPLSLVVPAVSSWSLVAAVLSIAVFGERVRPLQLAGAALVFAGLLAVSLGGNRGMSAADRRATLWPTLAALGAALGFGVMIPLTARIAPALGALKTSAAIFVAVLALGLPLARAIGHSLAPPPRAVFGLVLLTAVAETVGFVAVILARQFAPMTVVGPLASLASTFTVAYAWLVLRERQGPVVLLGGLLVGAGVVMLAL